MLVYGFNRYVKSLYLLCRVLFLLSNGEPKLLKILDVCYEVKDFLHQLDIDDDTLTKAIIGPTMDANITIS